jgi:hypothetical protein
VWVPSIDVSFAPNARIQLAAFERQTFQIQHADEFEGAQPRIGHYGWLGEVHLREVGPMHCGSGMSTQSHRMYTDRY